MVYPFNEDFFDINNKLSPEALAIRGLKINVFYNSVFKRDLYF